jgi:hypothetical protein
MIDINSIATQVKHNCNISDARYWGLYSPCGLLLRLRDLYRIENGMKPREKISHARIGEWIDKREELWHEVEDHNFRQITIHDKTFNPFDTKGLNSVLINHGFFYGAGYGNLLKPVFLLTELSDKYSINIYNIHITGREIARDLSTSPAMIQGNTVIARYETMNLFLWGKFEEMRARKCKNTLSDAFSEYGISKDIENHISSRDFEERFSEIVQEELSTYIYHELGEASQRRILGKWWKHLLLKLPYSRAELFLRGLKDVLSDTCKSGMLSYIIRNKKAGSLSFYVALLGGIRGSIFLDMLPAYEEFTRTRNWNLIDKARVEGYKIAGDYVRELKEMFDKGRTSREFIEQELMPTLDARRATK